MGCTSRDKVASQLPVASPAVRIVANRRPKKSQAQALRAIRDFHCPVCGLTKRNYPNFFHRCPGPNPDNPVGYQAERAAICGACDHARDGICLPLLTKHPDYPCEIAVGLRMPGAQCPLLKWPRVLFACDRCGSVRFDASGLAKCPTCHPPHLVNRLPQRPAQKEQ